MMPGSPVDQPKFARAPLRRITGGRRGLSTQTDDTPRTPIARTMSAR